jgi:Zn-dependent protease
VNIRFSRREIRDLAAAWIALGIAFTLFLNPELVQNLQYGAVRTGELLRAFALSMVTVGLGFLLHELAHKVVAVRFGQLAEFRADYSMLGLAILAALAGFLFAAPGAVHHRGRITERENGLIALAGPVVNVVLAAVFLVPALVGSGFLAAVGNVGFFINVLLAAFNMLPVGPLDGRTVLTWSRPVFLLVFAPTAGFGAWLLFGGLL